MTGGGTTARRETAPDLRDLMTALDYGFKDPELLRVALMHPSAVSTGRGKSRKKTEPRIGRAADNQRLEFLGDRVLGIVVAEMLFRAFPDEDEGALARRLAALVKQDSLDAVAREIALGRYLTISRGEEEGGGRANPAILADACEALIGAIYLDGGYSAAERFIRERLASSGDVEQTDYKSRLQEILQRRYKVPPAYELTEAKGPDHDKTFDVVVSLGKKTLGRGSGKSKKEAEQAAARDAMEAMERQTGEQRG